MTKKNGIEDMVNPQQIEQFVHENVSLCHILTFCFLTYIGGYSYD